MFFFGKYRRLKNWWQNLSIKNNTNNDKSHNYRLIKNFKHK